MGDEKPAAEAPAAEAPAADNAAAEKPAAEAPAAEKPAAETPAAEKPAAEKPAAEKPAAEKPAAEKPAAEKPAAEKPAAAAEKNPTSPTRKSVVDPDKQGGQTPANNVAPVEEAAPEQVAPADRAAWQRQTDLTMMKSRNQIREMLQRCRQNEIEEAANKAAAQEFMAAKAAVAKQEVMTRAAAHERVIDTSFRCMREIEEAILQMEDVSVKLKHERMAGFAALQVCTRRQDLREKRPVAETFADTLGEALTRERTMLEAARTELKNLEGESSKIIRDLTAMRVYLSADTGERRLEMAHDFSSLKVQVSAPSPKGKKPDQDGLDETMEGGNDIGAEKPEAAKPEAAKPEAAKPEAAKPDAKADNAKAEKAVEKQPTDKVEKQPTEKVVEKQSTEKAVEKQSTEKAEKPAAADKAVQADATMKPGDKDKAGKDKAADKATDKAPEEAPAAESEPVAPAPKMDSKQLIEETQKLLNRCRNTCLQAFALIDRVKVDSARALLKVEDSLARRTADLAAKKKNLEMHALDVDAAIQVAERSLEKLRKRLDPKDTKKAAKLKADVEVLEELKKSRKALQEDIRNKFAALEIDNLCRRVTPAKADSAQRETAMKEEKEKQKLTRNASAPTFRKKDMNITSFNLGTSGELEASVDGSTTGKLSPSNGAPASSPKSPAGNSTALKAAGASAVQ